jgi:hypothetical protein
VDDESSGSEIQEGADSGNDEIMPEPDVYQIRLTGPGLSMERAVDGETASSSDCCLGLVQRLVAPAPLPEHLGRRACTVLGNLRASPLENMSEPQEQSGTPTKSSPLARGWRTTRELTRSPGMR